MRRGVKRARRGLSSLKNDSSYFTHRSFDFRPSTVLPDDFQPGGYLFIVLGGVREHLFQSVSIFKPVFDGKMKSNHLPMILFFALTGTLGMAIFGSIGGLATNLSLGNSISKEAR